LGTRISLKTGVKNARGAPRPLMRNALLCPATPFKAINVEGNVVQLKAKPFKDEKNKDVKVDSFGF
jgi:hypothetical protein